MATDGKQGASALKVIAAIASGALLIAALVMTVLMPSGSGAGQMPGNTSQQDNPVASSGHEFVLEEFEYVPYDGKEHKLTPHVYDASSAVVDGVEYHKELVEQVDYTVEYEGDFVNVGTVYVTITGIGEYEGAEAYGSYQIYEPFVVAEVTLSVVSPKAGDKAPAEGALIEATAASRPAAEIVVDGSMWSANVKNMQDMVDFAGTFKKGSTYYGYVTIEFDDPRYEFAEDVKVNVTTDDGAAAKVLDKQTDIPYGLNDPTMPTNLQMGDIAIAVTVK